MADQGFRRVFIANRGEVAARVARTCDRLGVTPVFAVSEADAHGPWVAGRETVCVGPARAASSYLDVPRIVQAAKQTHCSALHPGWGFLAENPLLATLSEQHGITFIGPPAHVMALMGTKTPAKRAMRAAGLRTIDGSEGTLADEAEARRVADSVGYPIFIKAESGGGGRGMRIARSVGEVGDAFLEASAEAKSAFGDPRVYLEKLIEGGRHIEIQIFGDRYGNTIHLGERDCTVQRNHQKLIEESPSPVLAEAERARTLEAAARAAAAIGYVGAGTMEFLLDETGTLRFMEMNTRLQVEHCVTEMRCGLDLVEEQFRVAAGNPLSVAQSKVKLNGHALECRINAEDPSDGFRPTPGVIRTWKPPTSEPGALRIDMHVAEGYDVPPHYDSLICKTVTHAATRDGAIDRMLAALAEFQCEGVKTTIPMHRTILASRDFREHRYTTRVIPGWPPALGA